MTEKKPLRNSNKPPVPPLVATKWRCEVCGKTAWAHFVYCGACGHVRKVVASLAFLVVSTFAASAHIAGHPEWDAWLQAQRVPDGSGYACCDKADAYLLDDVDVRVRDGEYQGRIAGEWLTFPNTGVGQRYNTVFGPVVNPTGGAVAWVLHGVPRCFGPGTET